MKIGIFGGSFNPIHSGHAILANYISQYGNVDSVWLMLTPQNPLKDEISNISDEARIRMCNLVSEKCEKVTTSVFEFTLPKPNYTINTLNAISKKMPDHSFSLIIGADNWINFHKWKDYTEIINNYSVIIYPRRGYDIDKTILPKNVIYLENAPIVEISSTFIREALKSGKNMNHFLPEDVYDYIKRNSLYI